MTASLSTGTLKRSGTSGSSDQSTDAAECAGEEGNPSASKGEPSPDVSISLSRSQSAPPGLQDKEGPGSQSVEQEVHAHAF